MNDASAAPPPLSPSPQKRSRLWLWILIAVVGVIFLFAIISMVAVGMFSNTVQDTWGGAAEELGNSSWESVPAEPFDDGSQELIIPAPSD